MDRTIHVYDGASETVPCPYGEPLPDIPTSFLLVAPTASGKTMILLNLLLKFYMKGGNSMFARVFVFSPSIALDPQYAPLRAMLEKLAPKEQLYWDDMNQAALGRLLNDQKEIVESCRKKKIKPPQICVVLDDMADNGTTFTSRRGGNTGGSYITSLAVRGRHSLVTWIATTQKLNLIGLPIRINARCICVWRLRNQKEIENICEEMSAYYDKDTVLDLYRHATDEPYSFLFLRLDGKTRRDVFWLRFESRLIPS